MYKSKNEHPFQGKKDTERKGVALQKKSNISRQNESEVESAARYSTDYSRVQNSESNSDGAIQFERWDELDVALQDANPGTVDKTRFAMSIVNGIRDTIGTNARLGGSLLAKAFGGERIPVDIDIDIPGDARVLADAKSWFFGKIKKPFYPWIVGNDVFFITDWKKVAGVFELTYKSVRTQVPKDALDDWDELKALHANIAAIPSNTVMLDFASETLFELDGLIPTPANKDKKGFYSPSYLVASYLNRLAGNKASGDPDKKKDERQIVSILLNFLKKEYKRTKEKMSHADSVNYLNRIGSMMFKQHIDPSGKNAPAIEGLFQSAISQVLTEFTLSLTPASSSDDLIEDGPKGILVPEDTRSFDEITAGFDPSTVTPFVGTDQDEEVPLFDIRNQNK